MDLKWLEDFLCLARVRSFSRAAEARCVTQSAFSRRIRSLENWFGAPLIDRSVYPVTLTEAGEDFSRVAVEVARQLDEARAEAAPSRRKSGRAIAFAAQHSLCLDFFARWSQPIEARIGALDIRLSADNYYHAAQSLREGACDFLLCFTHPRIATTPHDLFESRLLARELLVPVRAPAPSGGRPRLQLPGDAATPTPYLSYGVHTFLGKAVRLILERRPCALRTCFEDAHSGSLKSMALRGRGVAWLPQSIVRDDIAAGRLEVIGDESRREALDIRLFRRPQGNSPLCERFWREVKANA